MLPLPPEATAAGAGERWVTVTARLARDESWAPAGHELSRGQVPVSRPEPPVRGTTSRPVRRGADLLLGGCAFDATTGRLLRVGAVDVLDSPRLDLWRAPTDNDRAPHGDPLEPLWRGLGLDRLRHRRVDVDVDGDALVVRERVGAAVTDVGFDVTYRWRGVAGDRPAGAGLLLEVTMTPDGELPCPLPRVGLRLAVPRGLDQVTWFGRGPGEAYADTGYGTWVSRFAATVDALQTPYVFPQENGNRAGVRWATLTDAGGHGLRVEGDPTVDLTVRRWSTEALDRARHTVELVDDGRLHVNLDVAQQGIGTASCGPGVLPGYRLAATATTFSVLLSDQSPEPA